MAEAPRVSPYNLGRQELGSAFAPIYDFSKPIEKVRDRIVDRLEFAGAS
jgi:hypothetical protein